MKSIGLFNGLNGKTVSRKKLAGIISCARREEQEQVVARLKTVMRQYPDRRIHFKIEHPAIEQVPQSLLHCLDCETDHDSASSGLAKPVSPSAIYDMIRERMLAMIKEANKKDYHKAWGNKSDIFVVPMNFISKKPYRGINFVLTGGFTAMSNPYLLTFKQIDELGGKLRKGSEGVEVVYFTKLYELRLPDRKLHFASYDRAKVVAFAVEKGVSPELVGEIPILKYYNVFRASDVEGIDFKLDEVKLGRIPVSTRSGKNEANPIAQSIFELYPSAPELIHGGEQAYYTPYTDVITMPPFEDFDTGEDYYRTLFHEVGHSTGSKKRLSRDFSGKYGSPKYAKEELVAEWCAVFLSAHAGIVWHNDKNHAAYLKSWNAAIPHIESDPKFVMNAATQAQKAADYVLDLDKDGNPAYLKKLADTIKEPKAQKPKAVKATKPKKPEPKEQIVGYALVDNISGEMVGSKSRLEDLEQVYLNLEDNEKIADMEPLVYEIVKRSGKNQLGKQVKVQWKRPEAGKQLTLALSGKKPKKTKGLASAAPPVAAVSTHPKVRKIGSASASGGQFYEVDGQTGAFLQRVERKPVGSVVITLDGEQGAGKTTALYKFMNDFASPGNQCLFISGEEHPESSLAIDKANQYLSDKSRQCIDTVAEVESLEELYKMIAPYDIIFIDSWQKLIRMVGPLRLDEDLRKKIHGKVFVIIFQQTTTGRTKGGAEIVFDGDIIIKMVKEARFSDNYAYFDKNRYTLVPLESIRYNIASGECILDDATQPEVSIPAFSFEIE